MKMKSHDHDDPDCPARENSQHFGVTPSRPPIRVLFVCMGNICRSPAAENLFRHLARKRGVEDRFEIDSAGTIGHHAGNPPDPRMSRTLAARGIPVEGRARRVTRADLDGFDHILVADHENLRDVRALDPKGTAPARVRILASCCQRYEADHIPDPYYGGQQGFEQVADLLEDACRSLLDELLENEE